MAFIAGVEPLLAGGDSLFIPVQDNRLWVENDRFWRPLNLGELTEAGFTVIATHFLGYLDQVPCQVVEVATSDVITREGWQWKSLRTQLGLVGDDLFLLAGRALQTVQWDNDHRFCSRCGRPTEPDGVERAKVCHACERHFYPRLSPCIITLVTRGNECLLARHARASRPVFSPLAGFIEVGERPEDTIHREVREEVGIEVHSLAYVASQPWPFPGQLMLGFSSQYASGEIQVDGVEILEAGWFRFDRLPDIPHVATLSGQLIARFLSQHR